MKIEKILKNILYYIYIIKKCHRLNIDIRSIDSEDDLFDITKLF